MCGICGYISKNRIERAVLQEMRDTMYHRGPDDAGILLMHNGPYEIGMAHRRLSIIDLTEFGHQPMQVDDGAYSIVYNGEIYNFRELRIELEDLGYRFNSTCDTEVVLYSYKQWGENCFEHFNGMFAIAIWDQYQNRLVMARDRMGVKPLYYYWNRTAGEFIFASELKPIMKYPGFRRDVRTDMIGQYLCNKYIAAPNTIFQDTYKMIPGSYLVYDGDSVKTNKYWDLVKNKRDALHSYSYIDNLNALDDCLTDAVKRRLIADVPVGTFLSSGIDSALISAIAQKVTDQPIQTYTIGFHEKERDEADAARAIAAHIGSRHTELYVGEQDILDMLDGIVDYYDEPFSDSSQLPTMLVSKMASEHIKVAISGDGGDELFCGYKMYDWTYIAQMTDWIGNVARACKLPDSLLGRLSPELRAFINNGDKGLKTQLYTDVMEEIASQLLGGIEIPYKFDVEKELNYKNWQERRMVLDMMTYLPDDIMCKTDRASMKYSLEVRSPLLDYRLVEISFGIPHDQKYHNFEKKHILRELAYKYVPKELLSGPKRGFGIPLAKWLRTTLRQDVRRVTDNEYLKRQGVFDPAVVEQLIYKQQQSDKIMYSAMLWSIYIFQRWWETYLGDVA